MVLCNQVLNCLNPLVPSMHKSARIAKISHLKSEGITKKKKKKSCNESVDEKSLSYGVNAQEATTRACVRACRVKLSFRKIDGNRRKCAHRTRVRATSDKSDKRHGLV